MANKFDRHLAHVARREQVWKDLVDRLGKSIPVADLDIMFEYLGAGSLQSRTVDYLLSESLKVAKGAEVKMSVNDGYPWGKSEFRVLAGQGEAGHNSACASGANEKQVGGSHYRQPIQHWDYVVANNMPYLEARAFAYVDRHAKKGGRADLEKAKHFIDKMIEVYYPNK